MLAALHPRADAKFNSDSRKFARSGSVQEKDLGAQAGCARAFGCQRALHCRRATTV